MLCSNLNVITKPIEHFRKYWFSIYRLCSRNICENMNKSSAERERGDEKNTTLCVNFSSWKCLQATFTRGYAVMGVCVIEKLEKVVCMEIHFIGRSHHLIANIDRLQYRAEECQTFPQLVCSWITNREEFFGGGNWISTFSISSTRQFSCTVLFIVLAENAFRLLNFLIFLDWPFT